MAGQSGRPANLNFLDAQLPPACFSPWVCVGPSSRERAGLLLGADLTPSTHARLAAQ